MGNIVIEEIKTSLSAFDIYKMLHHKEGSFILDSGMDHQNLGKYSFVGMEPFMTVTCKHKQIVINKPEGQETVSGNPFDVLKELISTYRMDNHTGLPFVGGAVGFFSYDLCHYVEKLPQTAIDDINLPDMVVGFYHTVLIFEHFSNKTYLACVDFPGIPGIDPANTVMRFKAYIEQGRATDTNELDLPYASNTVELVSNFTYDEYCQSIEKARGYIQKGDIYQMNMTQRFSTCIKRHPINIYSYLRTINPAPFAAYMNYGDMKILSSSPERFIRLNNGCIETRPIKGTMPRGKGAEEDAANMNLLKSSIKDKAENLMIVDLMRNDIGKVCKFGSVKVTELFHIEKYSTVFQMVSNIVGEVKEDCDAVDCIKATFPGGSITGAPKIRSMEVIDELEPTCRNVYTGSIGYIGFDGNMDLNIVIRTILINKHNACYQVGGGIVWDSTPEKEYLETMDKGAALEKALKY